MNAGVISVRYAKALLAFSREKGEAETVCRQARVLLAVLRDEPRFHVLLADPAVEDAQKQSLLVSALGDEPPASSLERFWALVLKNGRMPFIRLILNSFINQYLQSQGIRTASMTTAVEVPAAFEEKFRSILQSQFGGTVVLEKHVDPSLIGGVIFTVDDWRIDASVAGQLERLREEFIDKNKRIV